MNGPDRETTMRRVGRGLLFPTTALALVLLGINCAIIASEFHEPEYAPPPLTLIPLPITGWLTWLLWPGPLAVVSLIFTPGLAGHLLTLLRTQAIRKGAEGA